MVRQTAVKLLRFFPILYRYFVIIFPKRALNNLDQQLVSFLPESGFFIEAGANDGVLQSNSAYLEFKKRWTGILIEPIPYLFEILRKTRSKCKCLNIALVGDEKIEYVDLYDNDLLSSQTPISRIDSKHLIYKKINTYIRCKATTLNEIMIKNDVEKVDLLILDVEGAEEPILRSIIQKNLNISFILLETKYIIKSKTILESKYNLIEKLSYHDYLFQKKL